MISTKLLSAVAMLAAAVLACLFPAGQLPAQNRCARTSLSSSPTIRPRPTTASWAIRTIQTPHLDRLATQSVVFTRGYTPTSLCRSSLMTIITGLYPHQHLMTGNDPPKGTDRREMLRHVRRTPTLPKLLAEQGYVSFQSRQMVGR